jgi:uncharacterized protein YutE (UPF0331/DUF86 family)
MREKKIRKEIIKPKVRSIIDSVNLVGDNLPEDFESFSRMGLAKEGIYKKIEFAIESIIDICNIIHSDLDLGIPESEDDIIEHLEKNKIFNKKIIDLIKEMKGFRNILVHKYDEINDEKAFENIKEGLKDFELMIKEIEGFLKKQKS